MQDPPDRAPSPRLNPAILRRLGLRLVMRKLLGRLWSQRTFYELVVELADVPAVRGGDRREPVMEARDSTHFRAFHDALATARGEELLELRWRAGWCSDDVRQLYAAADARRTMLYAQWLIGPEQQALAYGRHLAGTRPLAADERIVEAAYTFPSARRRGLMKLGMEQLLVIAREQGASRVWTYVELANTASLRGCAALGFRPAGLRRQRLRLGFRSAAQLPLEPEHQERWEAVTAARS